MKNKAVPIVIVVLICFGGLLYVAGSAFFGMQKEMMKKERSLKDNTYVVDKGDVVAEVIETGPLEASRVVEVKSRVQGRVKQLFVDEGDIVKQGQLVALIDPQETELQVKQNQAQLRGAQAGVSKTDVDIAQRRVTAVTNLEKNRSRLRQIELELREQPLLTSTSIQSQESALAAAQQSLDLLVRVTQPNTRVQVQSALDEAKSNLQNSQFEYERRQNLFKQGYVSRRELEAAQLSLDLAKTRLTTAEERLAHIQREQALERSQADEKVKQARQELTRARSNRIQDTVKLEDKRQAVQSVRDAEIALRDIDALIAGRRQQLATVDQLQSALSDSLRQLGETEIRAPVSGIVTKRLVQLGELVASLSSFSSGTPIFRVEDRSAMKVKLNVNEIDVAKLKVGTKASIRVDAFPEKTYEGRVSKIAPSSNDSAAGAAGSDPVVKYAVEVTLNSAPSELKSGMSALCTITVSGLRDTVRVRQDFIGQNPDKSYFVEVVTNEKKLDDKGRPAVKKVSVILGPSSGAYAAVTKGIKAGDKLYKPAFVGPPRKTFFQDGDEANRAESKKKEEEDLKMKREALDEAEGAKGSKASKPKESKSSSNESKGGESHVSISLGS